MGKFMRKSAAANILRCQNFAVPGDNPLGHSILELLQVRNSACYDELLQKIEELSKRKTYKVAILEIGPGAGDGINKVWTKYINFNTLSLPIQPLD